MQNEKNITISNGFLEILSDHCNDISKEFGNELVNHKDAINMLLTAYYCQERGTVYNHTIDNNTIEIDHNGKGIFIVDFEIHYALEGYTDKDKMKIEFNFNLKTGEIVLKGEVFPD